MDRLPSLNALRAFVSVARTGSVVAASNELYVTASAVSHQLRRLEEEIGVSLFVRSGKSLTLTPEGEVYFGQLRDAFDRIEVATHKVRRTNEEKAVTVTTLPVFAIKWLVKRLAQFHTRYPEIEVRIGTAYKTFDLTVTGHDLAIRWGNGRWPGMTAIKLMPDVIQPVCSPTFLAVHGPLTSENSGLTGKLIHMGQSRDDWRGWFALNGMKYSEAAGSLHFSEPTSAIQAAIDGLGIVLGPHALIEDDLKSGRLIPANTRVIMLHDAYYLVFPARTGMNKTARLFADWVTNNCSDFALSIATPDFCLLPNAVKTQSAPD